MIAHSEWVNPFQPYSYTSEMSKLKLRRRNEVNTNHKTSKDRRAKRKSAQKSRRRNRK